MSRFDSLFGWTPKIPNFWALVLAGLSVAQTATAAYSASRHGITWTWSEDRQVGQYANGDWWVVGPVTITSITPESGIRVDTKTDGTTFSRRINGTMVNPLPQAQVDASVPNGFDNAVSLAGNANIFAAYDGTKNVAPSNTGQPLVCAAGTSVVSSISTAVLPPNSSNTQIERICTLTVVGQAPSEGAFRPPPTGTDKTHHWNKSQLDYTILRQLEPVASTPSLSSIEAAFAIPWTTFHTGNPIQSMTPAQMPNYGRDQAWFVSDALLSLHLNYTNAQKEKLFISLVQYGIDIYGFLRDGGTYRGAGGLNLGHKAPLVLAAVALDNPLLRDWANGNKRITLPGIGKVVHPFAEDNQMFVVQQSDVGRVLYTADGRSRELYRQEHVGLPEWGEQHGIYPQYDASNWAVPYASYRDIAGSSNTPNALGIRLLRGGEAAWNNPIFFDYCARHWAIEGAGTWEQQSWKSNQITRFHFNMLKAYWSMTAPSTTLPPAAPTGVSVKP